MTGRAGTTTPGAVTAAAVGARGSRRGRSQAIAPLRHPPRHGSTHRCSLARSQADRRQKRAPPSASEGPRGSVAWKTSIFGRQHGEEVQCRRVVVLRVDRLPRERRLVGSGGAGSEVEDGPIALVVERFGRQAARHVDDRGSGGIPRQAEEGCQVFGGSEPSPDEIERDANGIVAEERREALGRNGAPP